MGLGLLDLLGQLDLAEAVLTGFRIKYFIYVLLSLFIQLSKDKL